MSFMDIPSIIDSLGRNKDVTYLIAIVLIYSVKQLIQSNSSKMFCIIKISEKPSKIYIKTRI